MITTALVLAAGTSTRLGRPKQLLPFRGGTLLDATLATVRAAGFDQVLVTLGGGAADVLTTVDLSGAEVVHNPDYGSGCGSSVRSAVAQVRDDADGLVLLLGDQPGVAVEAVHALLSTARRSSVGVCRYDDGPGHPLWFHRRMFAALGKLHGDKAVWKLVDGAVEVPVPGPVPLDVDTWDDYRRLLDRDRSMARP